MNGLLLKDGSYSVFLHPPTFYSNGEGYNHQVDVSTDAFIGSFKASSYWSIAAFKQFHDELVLLYQTLKGTALLGRGYENFSLSLTGDGLGHIKVSVSAISGPLMDTHLDYKFTVDQTQIPTAIQSISQFLNNPMG